MRRGLTCSLVALWAESALSRSRVLFHGVLDFWDSRTIGRGSDDVVSIGSGYLKKAAEALAPLSRNPEQATARSPWSFVFCRRETQVRRSSAPPPRQTRAARCAAL